jgi:hypothetical protein
VAVLLALLLVTTMPAGPGGSGGILAAKVCICMHVGMYEGMYSFLFIKTFFKFFLN